MPRLLTGGLACYAVYETADGRHLTVGALEPVFFARLCELVERPELAARQYAADQEALGQELAAVFASRPLGGVARALRRRGGVRRPGCLTRRGARRPRPVARAPARRPLGAHTEAWRAATGLA